MTTVAGGGTKLGDGLAATSARLGIGGAGSLAFDGVGNLYVSDIVGWPYQARVRRVDASGTITTVVGGGGNRDPQEARQMIFGWGMTITVDANGTLIVGDPYSGRVMTLDRYGIMHKIVGTESHATSLGDGGPALQGRLGFMSPAALAVDSMGNLFIADGANNRVRQIAAAAAPQRTRSSGWNGVGQLGTGSTRDSHAPAASAGVSGVSSAAAGWYHSLAVKGDGTVWASGSNGQGQLGDGTTPDRWSPVRVAGLTNVTAVSAGALHSLALKADGTVWAWGWNAVGQLGDGTRTDRRTPVAVTGLAPIVAISAGANHNIALAADGSAWTWGWNAVGQRGDGTTSDRWTPVRVPGLSGVTSVSAGGYHTLAVQDPWPWAWGWNAVGQMGDGTTTDRPRPVVVTAWAGSASISAGLVDTAAVR